MAAFNFNLDEVAPADGFDVIPAGKYIGQIMKAELRATKAGTGQYVWLEQDILEGQYTGRKLWTTLNIINPSQGAVDIALRQLRALCDSIGVKITDDEHLPLLLFKPVVMVVKVKPASGTYDASNEVAGYMPVEGYTPRQATAPAQVMRPSNAGPVAVASVVKVAPWMNRPRVA